jgi:hypothetical protein
VYQQKEGKKYYDARLAEQAARRWGAAENRVEL